MSLLVNRKFQSFFIGKLSTSIFMLICINGICILNSPNFSPKPPITFIFFVSGGLNGIFSHNSFSYSLYWDWDITDFLFATVQIVIPFKLISLSPLRWFYIMANSNSMSNIYVLPYVYELFDTIISSTEASSIFTKFMYVPASSSFLLSTHLTSSSLSCSGSSIITLSPTAWY